jgi:hypothetical protein
MKLILTLLLFMTISLATVIVMRQLGGEYSDRGATPQLIRLIRP